MRFWYDTEFLEDGRTIDLISIGMVAENGSEFYAVSSEFDQARARKHPFLAEHVLPHLPGAYVNTGTEDHVWMLDPRGPRVMYRDLLRIKLLDFISLALSDTFESDENRGVELRAWYGAYDHVALMQLWGSMIAKPDVLPMWTYDLRQRWQELGQPEPKPAQEGDEHNALADARWNRALDRMLDGIG